MAGRWTFPPDGVQILRGPLANGWAQFVSRPTEASRSTTQSGASRSVASTTESSPGRTHKTTVEAAEETSWRHRSCIGNVGCSWDHHSPEVHTLRQSLEGEARSHRSPSQGATLPERGIHRKESSSHRRVRQRESGRGSRIGEGRREKGASGRGLLPKKFQSTVRTHHQNWRC